MKKRIASAAVAPPSPPMEKTRRRQYQKIDKPKAPAPQVKREPIHSLDHPPAPIPPIITTPAMPIPQPKISVESILAGQLSPQTRRAYRSDLNNFLAYLGHPNALDKPDAFLTVMQSVTRETAANYRDALLAEGKAATTIARRLAALNTVFDILREEEIITRNPLGHVRRPKVSREGRTHAFTQEQAERILSQPDTSTPIGKRDRIINL